jgi:hypothetical protein
VNVSLVITVTTIGSCSGSFGFVPPVAPNERAAGVCSNENTAVVFGMQLVSSSFGFVTDYLGGLTNITSGQTLTCNITYESV